MIRIIHLFIAIVYLSLLVPSPLRAQQSDGGHELISVEYKDADLINVLNALAFSNELNIVTTKDIKGKVSANLKELTVDEALQAILNVNGYTYIREGKLIYIVPGAGVSSLGHETVTLHLNFLAAADAKQLLTKVISSQGDIQINAATNSLVVTDFRENIANVRKVLTETDVPPLQVLIEAKILDIQAQAFENIGTTISGTYDPRGASVGGGLFGRSSSADESLTVGTDLTGPSSSVPGGQMTVQTVLKDLDINVTLDALIQHKKARLLAAPSIATLNGHEARIIIGNKVPIIQQTVTQTSTTNTTTFVDVGTTLKVTPQVSPDGWITMQVHPEVSSVTSTVQAGPNIATREADAVVRIKDGQTIIIGGLISKQDDGVEGGVPLLKSIPLIGKLFSNRSKDQLHKELTVFITPHIIHPGQQQEYAQRSLEKENDREEIITRALKTLAEINGGNNGEENSNR